MRLIYYCKNLSLIVKGSEYVQFNASNFSLSYEVCISENIKIINSKFFYCDDKAIQLTRGSNIIIKGNEFYGCAKAVRIKEKAKNIRIEGNKILDSKCAIKITGGEGFAKSNIIKGSDIAFWAEKNGKLEDEGGNIFIDVIERYKETEGGKITNRIEKLTN
tara:strand:- start:188 stop:670 length:483 start_codon:yes stop_codon:yes gene_type:complete